MIVDVVFPVRPAVPVGVPAVPADHSYALLGAIASVTPAIHGDPAVGIFPLPGRLGGARDLILSVSTTLTVRAPVDRVAALLPLAGKTLPLAGCRLHVGAPNVRALVPARSLYSRLVIIKHGTDAAGFIERAWGQLTALGVTGNLALVSRRAAAPVQTGIGGREPWVRRTIRVQHQQIVGYAVRVDDLSDADSLVLQGAGLGGKRRLGAGLFVPLRGHT